MIQVCLKADLVGIIRNYFQQEGVNFTDFGDAVRTAALYCEVNTRRIAPRPRRVRLSNEIHGTLGRLAHEADPSKAQKAQAAWRTVFRLRQKFSDGEDVTPYLSKGILNRPEEPDGLLWDYGLHHLHLNEGLEVSGYIQRSDYLLFVVVTEDDAFFVDVRLHRDPKDLQWVRQDLPQMIHSNWPQLMEGLSVEGVTETTVSDKEKKELRRKNVNVLHQVGGQVLFPLGRGTTAAGSSVRCRLWASNLLEELERHESCLKDMEGRLRTEMQAKGIDVTQGMELQLVLLEELNLSAGEREALEEDRCLGRALVCSGFSVVENTTRVPIIVMEEG